MHAAAELDEAELVDLGLEHDRQWYFDVAFHCAVPKAGGTADCELQQPRGAIVAYLFDGDDLWIGASPNLSGIDGYAMKNVRPEIEVSSVVTDSGVGRITLDRLEGLTVDATDVFWSNGTEIRARAKATVVRTSAAGSEP